MYDCIDYSENELSMLIYNDEGLYQQRHMLTKDCLEDIGFQFTDEQWEVFQNDLNTEEE